MALTVNNMRNFTGYLNMSTRKINAYLDVLQNPRSSTADKLAAKQVIKTEVKKIVKMMQTVAEKEGYSITVSRYTDQELVSMKLM